MAVYTINDIEKLSGVKAHTIRIWEKRYSFLPNRRTDTNIRYYQDEDLELILNIAHLNRNGLKISKIANLSAEEIKQKVANSCEVDAIFDQQIDGLMLSMFELNEFKFLKILNHKIKEFGFEKTMDNFIYPLLDKLSIMWIAGSVKSVHENFINNIIKRKLVIEIDKIKVDYNNNEKKFFIYLPEYEAHEMSILYTYYLLKSHGVNTLYLGSQLTINDVKDAFDIFKPSHIFTIFNDSFSETPLQPYIDSLLEKTGDAKILISGYQTIQQKIQNTERVFTLKSLEEIKSFI